MKIYKSEIDMWLIGVFIGTLLLPFILAAAFGGPFWPALIICGAVAMFIIWLYQATKYIVTPDEITVHAGLYKVNIPLTSIVSVTPSRDPLSSPAFSLNRLEIRYNKDKRILISPKDRERFLSDIGWDKPLEASHS